MEGCKHIIESTVWEIIRGADFRDELAKFASKSVKSFALEVLKWGAPILVFAWSAVIGMAVYNINIMQNQMERMNDNLTELSKVVISVQATLQERDKYEQRQKNN